MHQVSQPNGSPGQRSSRSHPADIALGSLFEDSYDDLLPRIGGFEMLTRDLADPGFLASVTEPTSSATEQYPSHLVLLWPGMMPNAVIAPTSCAAS